MISQPYLWLNGADTDTCQLMPMIKDELFLGLNSEVEVP